MIVIYVDICKNDDDVSQQNCSKWVNSDNFDLPCNPENGNPGDPPGQNDNCQKLGRLPTVNILIQKMFILTVLFKKIIMIQLIKNFQHIIILMKIRMT